MMALRFGTRKCAAALVATLLVLSTPAWCADQEGYTPIPVIKGIESLRPGDKAPMFSVKDLKGETFDLAKEVGKRNYLLVFWSIYCEPCREEMPLIEKTHNTYLNKGLQVLSVNLDGDPFLDAVKGFIKQGKYSFRVLMDELTDENFKIADPYNVAGTPVVYLINKKGEIVYGKVGRVSDEELIGQIEKVLANP